MATDTKVIIGTIVSTLLILIVAIFLSSSKSSPAPSSSPPTSISIDKTEVDFGDMKVTDEKSADFTLTNTGDSPLKISNISTSCNCTFASIEIAGRKTPEFSMHASGPLKNWVGEVPPGQTATLKATYRPKVMPVNGLVTRSVYFQTNDPQNSKVEITLRANVL